MPQSLVKVLVHIVFSTKQRAPLINPDFETELYAFISSVAQKHNCRLVKGNGIDDHVHLLVSLGRTTDVSELIGAIKRDSSRWIKERFGLKHFHWQAGYGAFSVSQSQIDTVIRYIANQKEHHKTQSFQDEFRALLNRHRVEYDERYVWD